MKKMIMGAWLVLVSWAAEAQQQRICLQQFANVPSRPASVASNRVSATQANQMVNGIMAAIGLKPSFEVQQAAVGNAAATMYRGKRWVLYNPAFIAKLNTAAGNNWASVSVLAHEIGHHLNGHTLYGAANGPQQELDADEFSGFVLQRMGASLQEAQLAMKVAAGQHASATHPGQEARLTAIAQGFASASGEQPAIETHTAAASSKTAVATTASTTVKKQPAIEDAHIVSDVHFDAAQQGDQYFVTTRFNLVRLRNNELAVVGKIAATSNENYPFVISSGNGQSYFVNKQASIVDRQGNRVGRLLKHVAG